MKKLSAVVLCVLAFALFAGCSNAAGENGSEAPIDYQARLTGTWKTKGYDNGTFIDFITGDLSSCKLKMKYVFTEDTYQSWMEVSESTINGLKNGSDDMVTAEPLYGVDENYYYTAERKGDGSPGDGQPIQYSLKDNALYIVGLGPLYKE